MEFREYTIPKGCVERGDLDQAWGVGVWGKGGELRKNTPKGSIQYALYKY